MDSFRRLHLPEEDQSPVPALVEALTVLVARYVRLVESGDCGCWDPEEEEPVIAARAALEKAGAR